MRTKKIFLNMICDILPYLIIGVIGIVKMDVLINYIGDVGNGYYQTINQIISYVFLAQMGFSEAVTYSLYKPFADKNKDNIKIPGKTARTAAYRGLFHVLFYHA